MNIRSIKVGRQEIDGLIFAVTLLKRPLRPVGKQRIGIKKQEI